MTSAVTPEYPRTDITRDNDGDIIQLDTYAPEVRSGEIVIGVDVAEFSRTHPVGDVQPGGVAVAASLYNMDDAMRNMQRHAHE